MLPQFPPTAAPQVKDVQMGTRTLQALCSEGKYHKGAPAPGRERLVLQQRKPVSQPACRPYAWHQGRVPQPMGGQASNPADARPAWPPVGLQPWP